MSEDDKADNVIRVDFRQRQVVTDDDDDAREVALDPVADEAQEHEPKHLTFARLIEQGLVTVKLDARVAGVRVPEQFEGVQSLHLSFSHGFHIDDFTWDEDSVRASLGFDTRDFYCVVPWSSIYQMICVPADECHIYPDSYPEELRAMLPHILERVRNWDPDA